MLIYGRSLEKIFSCRGVLGFFKNNGPNLGSFWLFSVFSHGKYSTNLTIKDKSLLRLCAWALMVGADESTELLLRTKGLFVFN